MEMIKLDVPNHVLRVKLDSILKNGKMQKDIWGEQAFKMVTEKLAEQFTAKYQKPFRLTIAEFVNSYVDPHVSVDICTSGELETINDDTRKPMEHLVATQRYAAWHDTDPNQNYMGRVEIEAYMCCPGHTDDSFTIDPDIYVLVNLAFMNYYAATRRYYTDFNTDYRNCPNFEKVQFIDRY